MDLDPWLARAAARRPERIALETPASALTYASCCARRAAARAARARRRARRPRGARAAAGPDFVVALHACLLARRGRDAGRPAAGRARAGGAAARARGGHRRAAARRGRRARATPAPLDAAALVVHTSGTTGAPAAGRAHAREHPRERARLARSRSGSTADERWLCPLPLSHVGGLMVLLRSAHRRRRPRVLGAGRRALARTDHARLAGAHPARAAARRRRAARRRGCGAILLGGGRPTRAARRARATPGCPVAPTYGLTQACSAVTVAEPGDVETRAAPLPGVERRDRRRRRDPGLRPDRRAAAARCAPATSAGSTSAAG